MSALQRLRQRFRWMSFCVRSAVRGNDFDLFPTVKMESEHPAEGPVGREFSQICNFAE